MKSTLLAVRDCMTTSLTTVAPHTEITKVVHILIEQDISGVVVTDNSTVVGIVTERDCIAAATSADYYAEWGGPVEKFMSSPVECVRPDENLVDVADRMTTSAFRRFPVVEDGRLVGLLSRRDVMRALNIDSWFRG